VFFETLESRHNIELVHCCEKAHERRLLISVRSQDSRGEFLEGGKRL
jgi:hypothetical protein